MDHRSYQVEAIVGSTPDGFDLIVSAQDFPRSFRMFRFTSALAVVVMFAVQLAQVGAQDRPWPWNMRGYQGYPVPAPPSKPRNPTAAPVPPTQYRVTVTAAPRPKTDEYAMRVLLVAHLPEEAQLYIGDQLTTSAGNDRRFVSPPLAAGKYVYSVRVDWVEEGKTVTQSHDFTVQPGMIHCIYLVKADSTFGEDAVVTENLAKLSPADRKLAEGQKVCAVQEQNRLGSMGPPVKLMIRGQPVFLCCEACTAKAQSNAKQTLVKVKELKANGPK
jgi:uncharacterized protein (TIGR03000 family)